METYRDTNFKEQAGAVNSLEGIIPEEGGLIFNRADLALYVGDGTIWTAISGDLLDPLSALATRYKTLGSVALPLGVVVPDITFYEEVITQRGTDIVPSAGFQVTFGKDMAVDMLTRWYSQVQDSGKVNVTIRGLLDGIEVFTDTYFYNYANTLARREKTRRFNVTSGQVLTLSMEADKACTFQYTDTRVGFNEVKS